MSQHGALHARRRRLLLASLLLGGLGLLGRGFQLQVLQAAVWEERAERQHRERITLPAERGTIYDRNGVPLATTRSMIRVATAPGEIEDRQAVAAALRDALGLSRAQVRRALNRNRRWVVIPGRYEPTVRSQLEALTGVYLERVLERFHPHGDLAVELVGRMSADGRPLDGVELEADSLLAGEDGFAVVRRDARGEPIPGALLPVQEPRPGHDVYLTVDAGLQEIAVEALSAAVAEQDAAGGDLIFVDPRSGEILAAASARRSGDRHWRGVTDPYEPGSTMKPFVMAALLEADRAELTDTVFAEHGYYRVGRREIRDVGGHGWLTAAEVLRHSSNIGMVKLAGRLTESEQYAALRDFGFGTPTGISYPSESGGRLTRPERWSAYSQGSLAMGYEVSVTPLQMTMAYGALANGGRLMQPRLIREIRGADGKTVFRGEARVIRRALSQATTRDVADVLADVVQEGTGHRAGLGTFHVAGKTGTARLFEDGSYRSDLYTASFAGFFPVRDPQLAFLVKLDRGSKYGGSVAAPVTRSTLAAALAARASPLDRRAVATALPNRAPSPKPAGSWTWLAPSGGPYVYRPAAGLPEAPARPEAGEVPDVRGRNARDAAAALHAAGFRVEISGTGRVLDTAPAAGSVEAPGAVVRVELGAGR